MRVDKLGADKVKGAVLLRDGGVVRFASSISPKSKVSAMRSAQSKWPLRQAIIF
jgi:hypothetical protein